jgi:hypothetical protein
MAAPMPREPPWMNATFPVRSILLVMLNSRLIGKGVQYLPATLSLLAHNVALQLIQMV